MKFGDDVWYAKWFFWALGIRDAFRPSWKRKEREIRKTNRTNFCFFFRTMTVTAPLIILLHAVVYAAAVLSLTWLPVYFFGNKTYFSVLGAIALVALIVLGVKKFLMKFDQPVQGRVAPRPEYYLHESIPAKEVEPSFRSVVVEWLVSLDKKICPTIEFSQKREVRR